MDDVKDDDTFKGGEVFFNQLKNSGVGDERFVMEIVEMFLEEGEETLQKLESAANTSEFENVRRYAHKLKSSFLMFDMNDAYKIALDLEQNDLTGSRVKINELKSACHRDFKLLKKKYLAG